MHRCVRVGLGGFAWGRAHGPGQRGLEGAGVQNKGGEWPREGRGPSSQSWGSGRRAGRRGEGEGRGPLRVTHNHILLNCFRTLRKGIQSFYVSRSHAPE